MQLHSTISPGFCQCGCGRRTNLAPQSSTAQGWVRGQPLRFIRGHQPHLRRKPAIDRFWRFVQKSDGCWLWTGHIGRDGYGYFHDEIGKNIHAHRWLFAFLHGPLLPDECIAHDCDKMYPPGDKTYRQCVRPDHLFRATNTENMADMKAKGRAHNDAAKTWITRRLRGPKNV